jgi:hypothetical protein
VDFWADVRPTVPALPLHAAQDVARSGVTAALVQSAVLLEDTVTVPVVVVSRTLDAKGIRAARPAKPAVMVEGAVILVVIASM